MLYTAIDHPAIACLDVKKQIAWYCENFGMRVIATNGQEPPAVVIGYGQTTRDGAMIEMMQVKDPGPRADMFARFHANHSCGWRAFSAAFSNASIIL